MDKALRQTEQAVADKKYPAIFEATFAHDDILARVDILERGPRSKWRLIEVKSSTKVKDYYLYDVAIQRLILEGLGMKVVPCLMHLNREYVYHGKQYELEKLFVIRDITDETAALSQDVKDLIREEHKVLAKATAPEIKPGSHCTNPERSWSTMNSWRTTSMTRGRSSPKPFAKLSGRRGACSLTANGLN